MRTFYYLVCLFNLGKIDKGMNNRGIFVIQDIIVHTFLWSHNLYGMLGLEESG